MKVKVLHLRDTDRVCGPGKTIIETCLRADQAAFDLAVGVFLRPGEESTNVFYQVLQSRGIKAIPFFCGGFNKLSVVKQLVRIIEEQHFDIVHAHEYKSDLFSFMVSCLVKVPVVTTAHGWIQNSRKSRAAIWLSKKAMRRFDRVIAVSSKLKDELIMSGVNPERINLIYNAIVTENYIPGSYEPEAVRKRHGLPESARLIGNIGRLSPEKGQEVFLKAAAKIVDMYPDLYFVIAGDGPAKKDLEALSRSLGLAERVIFTGYWDDVRPFYQDLEFMALTSYTEGFPNVLMEALCMGKPVLATSVGGVPDIIEDRQTGHLVQPGDWDAVAARMKELLNDPDQGKKMADKGKLRVLGDFQFKKRVNDLQNLYLDVLAQRGVPAIGLNQPVS